jgi:twinkle protein
MKIMSLKTKVIYDLTISRSGENHLPCPECSTDRKKKNAKSFSFNAETGVGHCFHCDVNFVQYKPQSEKKVYVIPEWKNKTKLTDKAAEWFRGRGILDDAINALSISSAIEFMPQTGKDESVVCFPYFRNGNLVNIKYRDGAKRFKLYSGAELIFYNIDSISNSKECVIVEGEIDCLSFIQAGIKNVISVPNGAGGVGMEYIDNCFDELFVIEKFYLAVDNDPPGYKLREELIRRLGAERCCIVPLKDCKDANEYLQKYGAFELGGVLKDAKDVPVSGIVFQQDIYDNIYSLFINGLQPGATIGVGDLDRLITWETGRVAVVTGIPGHGKSEIVDYIVARLNIIHGWKVAEYSPENYPFEIHHSKISSKICGKSFDSKYITQGEFEKVFDYVNDNYFFIYPEENVTIETILEKAKYLVRKRGIKILVIDPYNKLEHSRQSGESETDYISRFLDKISMFAKQNNCLVILVAHPRKMNPQKDNHNMFDVPTLYDINGSANFYNKCDYGLVVYRNFIDGIVKIIISKVKFKHLGQGGEVDFNYNSVNGRIHLTYETADFENYLTKQWINSEPELLLPEPDEKDPF